MDLGQRSVLDNLGRLWEHDLFFFQSVNKEGANDEFLFRKHWQGMRINEKGSFTLFLVKLWITFVSVKCCLLKATFDVQLIEQNLLVPRGNWKAEMQPFNSQTKSN